MALFNFGVKDNWQDEELFVNLDLALQNPKHVYRLKLVSVVDFRLLDDIQTLTNLHELTLHDFRLRRLPFNLGALKKLHSLTINSCDLSEFPQEIYTLKHLRYLALVNNDDLNIPNNLHHLSGLEELILRDNHLTFFPNSITQLDGLKRLNMSCNTIKSIPDQIAQLHQLENLSLEKNHLEALPENIGRLTSLKTLAVNNNKLIDLPSSLADLTQLETLHVWKNKFSTPPLVLKEFTSQVKVVTKDPYLSEGNLKISSKKEALKILKNLNMDPFTVEPIDPIIDHINEEIRLADLQEHSDIITRIVYKSIVMEATIKDDYSNLGNSRLGGFPDLPGEAMFPKVDNKFYNFLCQINLEDICTMNRFLPPNGLLSFFCKSLDFPFICNVLYTPAGSAELTTIRYDNPEDLYDPQYDFAETPYHLQFKTDLSLPGLRPNILQYACNEEEYDTLAEKYDLSEEHTINAHAGAGFMDDELAEDDTGGLLPWVPLLTLKEDYKIGLTIWDAGTIHFMIPREDLAICNFSRVRMIIDSC